jgi:hypothetical protein
MGSMSSSDTFSQNHSNKQQIALLRNKVEQKVGFSMVGPKNFDELKSLIEAQGLRISQMTLMRIWGYVRGKSNPTPYTLSILSRFLGYADWNDFCEQNPIEKDSDETEDSTEENHSETSSAAESSLKPSSTEETLPSDDSLSEDATPSDEIPPHRPRRMLKVATAVILAFLLGMVAYFAYNTLTLEKRLQTMSTKIATPKNRRLVCGKSTFQHPQEYLSLFGIPNKEPLWCQQLPTHKRIFVFTTTYKNKEWHNDGDASRLYPTITDYKTSESPNDVMQMELDSLTNRSRYYEFLNRRPVFIMFMNNMNNNHCITFLGVYRLSIPRSNIHHLVWERVAREVDLNNLGLVEQYLRY